ncbi:UDP-N-acetyl-D-glucosamine dehydrogenase, partial [bacterium]|nr:UDP-N-acetyl-D-glucosamine dehydrogenase [bacterium]
LGVSYKRDIDDCRESPALDIIEKLSNSGSNVEYYDKHVPEFTFDNIKLKSLKSLNKKIIKSFDLCCVITDHTNVDYNLIAENSKLIVDTRNVFNGFKKQNIKRLGEGKL